MTKISRFFNELSKTDADAALISSALNQRYLSGFDYTDGYILATRSRAFALADFRYIEAARSALGGTEFEVIMPEGSMLIELSSLLHECGVTSLIIEDASVSCADLERFKKAFGDKVKISGGASCILSKMREVKSADEFLKIKKAQEITDAAFTHILNTISPSMTEVDVALELEFFMRRNGAETISFPTIAVSGTASSMPHGVPRNVKLERGFLTMDFGARYEGYCADMTRTVVLGKADDEMKKLYYTVLDAQKAAIEMYCEGAECAMLDKCARDIIYGAGYEGCFGHSLGHGVGMYVHEAPRLASSAPKDSVLVRGNITSVEPGIYLEGKYGCRIEDLLMIDLDGSTKNITKSPKELIELF